MSKPIPFMRDLILLEEPEGRDEQYTLSVLRDPQSCRTATASQSERPEVALMRAVLEDAIGCFHKQFVASGRRITRQAREAEQWLFANDDRWPFSFIHICAVLGLNPDYLRRGLQRWRHYQPAAPSLKRRRVVTAQRLLKIAA